MRVSPYAIPTRSDDVTEVGVAGGPVGVGVGVGVGVAGVGVGIGLGLLHPAVCPDAAAANRAGFAVVPAPDNGAMAPAGLAGRFTNAAAAEMIRAVRVRRRRWLSEVLAMQPVSAERRPGMSGWPG
jgi:hypothetical protein